MSSRIAAFLMAWLAIAAVAQQPVPSTLSEVLAAHAAARGGESWAKVRSIHLEGTLRMSGTDVPVVLDLARPAKLRMVLRLPGGDAVQVYDGKSGWALLPQLGQVEASEVSAAELRTLAAQADLDGHLIEPQTKGFAARYLGPSTIAGVAVVGVELVRTDDGSTETHYLNAQTWLTHRVQTRIQLQGQDLRTDVTYSDYRTVDGKRVAFGMRHQTETAQGPIQQDMLLTYVAFDQRFPRQHFGKPVPVKPAAP